MVDSRDGSKQQLVVLAAVAQGKRLRINIASFILNEAGFTAAHPPAICAIAALKYMDAVSELYCYCCCGERLP